MAVGMVDIPGAGVKDKSPVPVIAFLVDLRAARYL